MSPDVAPATAKPAAPQHVVQPLNFVEPVRRRAYVYREASDGLHELYAALALAQGDIGTIPKRHRSHYGMYADLSDIREHTHKHLAKHGLTVHQTLQLIANEMILVTTLGHKSGQWINSVIPIRSGSNPQQTAASITYARRMALSAILNLATEEDDDGETAAVAAAASPGGTPGLYARARAAISSCQSKKELKEKLEKATTCFNNGQISKEEYDQLLSYADEVSRNISTETPNAQ